MDSEKKKGPKKLFTEDFAVEGERSEYHNLVDVLFVIDATGSMSWCIDQLSETVLSIMQNFSEKQYNIKFAIQLYRDHPPQQFSYIEKHYDLRSQKQIIKIIENECQVQGGGDSPQAVFDGLVNGLKKTSWRVSTDKKTWSKRFLFHGCDAPPHGKEYGGKSSDKNWEQNGCPCGIRKEDVKKLLNENNVEYYLIKCGNETDQMAKIFKNCFDDKYKGELNIQKQQILKKELMKASFKMVSKSKGFKPEKEEFEQTKKKKSTFMGKIKEVVKQKKQKVEGVEFGEMAKFISLSIKTSLKKKKQQKDEKQEKK